MLYSIVILRHNGIFGVWSEFATRQEANAALKEIYDKPDDHYELWCTIPGFKEDRPVNLDSIYKIFVLNLYEVEDMDLLERHVRLVTAQYQRRQATQYVPNAAFPDSKVKLINGEFQTVNSTDSSIGDLLPDRYYKTDKTSHAEALASLLIERDKLAAELAKLKQTPAAQQEQQENLFETPVFRGCDDQNCPKCNSIQEYIKAGTIKIWRGPREALPEGWEFMGPGTNYVERKK